MKERLNVSVEAGLVDKVRELAGGERKVGEFLSAMIAWAWGQRDVLASISLEECVLMESSKAEELERRSRRLAGMENILDNLGMKIDSVDEDGIV